MKATIFVKVVEDQGVADNFVGTDYFENHWKLEKRVIPVQIRIINKISVFY